MMHIQRGPLSLKLVTAAASSASVAVLLGTSPAQAQPPPASAAHVVGKELMRRDLVGASGKEVVLTTVEVPPGASSATHRHDAQVFVYVLQGRMLMQVKGGRRVTLSAGQTFYENPSDIHTLSANASRTEPAKFLAILIKDKNRPATTPVTPE